MREPNFLDKLPKDKLLHFAIGVVAFSFLQMFGLIPAIVLTLILGIGIEIYQKYSGTGAFEYMDAFAVYFGGAVVLFASLTPEIFKFL